jgi:hypothetical protein
MSAPYEPKLCPGHAQKRWRKAVLAALAVATFATAAEGKVVWDGDTLSLHPRDGARGRCRALPLFRAERLARREAFIVQRSGALFAPYLLAPHPLIVFPLRTEWLWSDRDLAAVAHECEVE